jgi:cytochrome c556
MRRIIISTIAFALCAAGLFAQDDLAQYQTHMKAAAAANMGLRKGVTEKDSAAIATNAANMSAAFDWIATFWDGKGKADASGFAKAASAAAKAVGDAKTPEDTTAALGKIQPNCGGCHAVYRAGTAFKGM